jgi:hypothetical protein
MLGGVPGIVKGAANKVGQSMESGLLSKLRSKPSFKSEIDWGKWNSEIPSNQSLMQEYNAIEQTSKANGTWMKNPDGSSFKGTPEQFVQQNSQNFKKAFGNTAVVDREGNPLIVYHGSETGIPNEFIPPKRRDWGPVPLTHKNMDYTYFHHDKDIAAEYSGSFSPGRPENYKNVASVYINSENPLIHTGISDPYEYIKDVNLEDYDIISSKGLGKDYNFDKLDRESIPFEESEIAVPYGNNVKSAIGNNGMFDMTNPNIYKALVPAVIGATALEQKKKGGVIKDDRGQWAHPGEITEIGSNQITMKGVPYPVLGISDTGDQQMMYPEQEYKFKGKKVTEYPMAQNGLGGTRADSIMLMNNAIAKDKFYKNNPNYFLSKNFIKDINFKDPKILKKLANAIIREKNSYDLVYKDNSSIISRSTKDTPNQFTITSGDVRRKTGKVKNSNDVYSAPDIIMEDMSDLYFNPASPPIFFSPSILPQGSRSYSSTEKSGYGDIASSLYYDPLAVTPWDMLNPKQQKERLKKYGKSGTPYASSNYKPQSDSSSKSKSTTSTKTTQKQKTNNKKGWKDYNGRGGNWEDDNGYIWTDQDPLADNYKKKPQPKPEPSLKGDKSKAKTISTERKTPSGKIKERTSPDVKLSPIQNLPYRVDYIGEDGKPTHTNFASNKEGEAFMKEIQNRKMGISGNIPGGSVEGYYENLPKKKQGGWLEKYN